MECVCVVFCMVKLNFVATLHQEGIIVGTLTYTRERH